MRRFIQIILASLIVCSCASQKNTKIYGYRQPVLQGVNPAGVVDEKGREVQMTIKEQANFFIYMESPAANMQVKEVWIKQKPYSVKTGVVTNTPVIITQYGLLNGGDTLVKATRNQVLQITPGLTVQTKKPVPAVQKKIKANDLVIHCVVNGKDQYYYLAAIKNLAPLALQ